MRSQAFSCLIIRPASLLLHPVMTTRGPLSNSLQTQEGSPPTFAPTFHSFHPHRGLQGTAITPLRSAPCPGLPLHCGVSALEDLPGSKRPCPAPTQVTFATFPAPDTEFQAFPRLQPAWDTVPLTSRQTRPASDGQQHQSAGGSLSPRWAAGG